MEYGDNVYMEKRMKEEGNQHPSGTAVRTMTSVAVCAVWGEKGGSWQICAAHGSLRQQKIIPYLGSRDGQQLILDS